MHVTTASLAHVAASVNAIRALSIDGVQKAKSGHPGMPLGAAPMAYALWTRHLKHNPANPKWMNRDRFVLSAGHGSMLLYSLLYLTGYDLSLDDLKQFRQWGSRTPGHPENHLTPGVEMATGPLGQGISTAVGMAVAEEFLRASTGGAIDHFTYVICSDGDLMEGISQEAASLAGHLKLGKLIALYDDNKITIDGRTDMAWSENVAARFEAYGWHTMHVDGLDVEAIDAAILASKSVTDRPSLLLCRTVIGYGSPKADSSKSHGAPLGEEETLATKRELGMPETPFDIPQEIVDEYRAAVPRGAAWESEWEAQFGADSTLHALCQTPPDWSALPTFSDKISTRNASLAVIQKLAEIAPNILGGCADLAESVMTLIKSSTPFSASNRKGRNLYYGIREHAMAACVNGIQLHGGLRAFGGTFLIFSDYCRPSLRLAALMETPSIFVFSHDSIGLGEDGPTHQPIEQTMTLRMIPNLNVMRPADGNETAACWQIAMQSEKTPSVLVLSRQDLPIVSEPVSGANHPAMRGAYTLKEASGEPKVVLIGTGSEVALCLSAAQQLEAAGTPTQVVSMPSWLVFDRQDPDYRRSVLPTGAIKVSVEAGVTTGWQKYADACVGIDHFGASAPGPLLMEKFGFTVDNVVATVSKAIG